MLTISILHMLERRVAGAAIVLLGEELRSEERQDLDVRRAAEWAARLAGAAVGGGMRQAHASPSFAPRGRAAGVETPAGSRR